MTHEVAGTHNNNSRGNTPAAEVDRTTAEELGASSRWLRFRMRLGDAFDSTTWEIFLVALSIVYMTLMVIEVSLLWNNIIGTDSALLGLSVTSATLLAIFTFESFVKTVAFGGAFWRRKRNLADFSVVYISFALQIATCWALYDLASPDGSFLVFGTTAQLVVASRFFRLLICVTRQKRVRELWTRMRTDWMRGEDKLTPMERSLGILRDVRHKYPLSDKDMLQLSWLIEVIETRRLYGGTRESTFEMINNATAYEGVSREVADWLRGTFTLQSNVPLVATIPGGPVTNSAITTGGTGGGGGGGLVASSSSSSILKRGASVSLLHQVALPPAPSSGAVPPGSNSSSTPLSGTSGAVTTGATMGGGSSSSATQGAAAAAAAPVGGPPSASFSIPSSSKKSTSSGRRDTQDADALVLVGRRNTPLQLSGGAVAGSASSISAPYASGSKETIEGGGEEGEDAELRRLEEGMSGGGGGGARRPRYMSTQRILLGSAIGLTSQDVEDLQATSTEVLREEEGTQRTERRSSLWHAHILAGGKTTTSERERRDEEDQPYYLGLQDGLDAFNRELDEWTFDVLAHVDPPTRGFPLGPTFIGTMRKNHVFDSLGGAISPAAAMRFVVEVELGYDKRNAYHNASHAADVLQCVHHLMTHRALREALTPLDRMVVLLAAAVHDLGHPGVNNNFLVATQDSLAMRYNDVSPLENFHASAAFEVMRRDARCDVLGGLPPGARSEARTSIIELVLATDMVLHTTILNQFRTRVLNEARPPKNAANVGAWHYELFPQDPNASFKSTSSSSGDSGSGVSTAYPMDFRRLIMKTALHLADISNPARPNHVCRRWAELIQEEFFRQGDLERHLAMGAPSTPVLAPFMDRAKPSIAALQAGFLRFTVKPLFDVYYEFCDSFRPISEPFLVYNAEYWQKLAAAGVTTASGNEEDGGVPVPPPLPALITTSTHEGHEEGVRGGTAGSSVVIINTPVSPAPTTSSSAHTPGAGSRPGFSQRASSVKNFITGGHGRQNSRSSISTPTLASSQQRSHSISGLPTGLTTQAKGNPSSPGSPAAPPVTTSTANAPVASSSTTTTTKFSLFSSVSSNSASSQKAHARTQAEAGLDQQLAQQQQQQKGKHRTKTPSPLPQNALVAPPPQITMDQRSFSAITEETSTPRSELGKDT